MRRSRTPPRDVVERIVSEEAVRHGVSSLKVLSRSNSPPATRARYAAIRRVLEETGCSNCGLAKIWGITPRTVSDAQRREPAMSQADQAKVRARRDFADRLTWAHGPERAAMILDGRDSATNTDIAAWRALCARADA